MASEPDAKAHNSNFSLSTTRAGSADAELSAVDALAVALSRPADNDSERSDTPTTHSDAGTEAQESHVEVAPQQSVVTDPQPAVDTDMGGTTAETPILVDAHIKSIHELRSHHPIPLTNKSWFTMSEGERKQIAANATRISKDLNGRNLKASSSRANTTAVDITKLTAKQKQITSGHQNIPSNTDQWISLIQCDTLEVAALLNKHLKISSGGNFKIGVLNMGDDNKPGGNFLLGTRAQEESLCARTTLYSSLSGRDFYAIGLPASTVIHSPDILVHGIDRPTQFSPEDRFFIDVLTCAAIRQPKQKRSTVNGEKFAIYASKEDEQLMEAKIIGILRVAVSKGITHLVLAAFGCGHFRNPIDQVAAIFRRCLVIAEAEENFHEQGIQQITFAIKESDSNAPTWNSFVNVFRDCEDVYIDYHDESLLKGFGDGA